MSRGLVSYKNIWRVAYPILISLVMEQMIGMTDTAFLGRVGEIELGASAIAIVFYMVIFMAGFGFSIGTQIIIGRRNGEGKYKATCKVFWQGLYCLMALSAIFVLLSEIFSPRILSFIVSSEQIAEAASTYVTWRLPGMVFAFATAMFRAFYVGTTQTKTLTFNAIVMLISNFVFNWILIFGKFGIPAMGIQGAAIGSSLAELVSLIFFIIYTRKKCDLKKYGLDRPAKLEWAEIKAMIPISSWTMIQHVVSLSTWFIFFLYVEHLGERALAVSNIVRGVSGVVWMLVAAFASTCSTLVSNLIGEGHQDAVMSLIKRILKLAYAIVLSVLLLLAIFPHEVIRVYTDIPELIPASVPAMLVMTSSYFVTVAAMVYFNAVSGTGNTKRAFVLELMALVVYLCYCTIVIGVMKADVAVCWTAEHVYALGLFVISFLYMKSGKWKNKVIEEKL